MLLRIYEFDLQLSQSMIFVLFKPSMVHTDTKLLVDLYGIYTHRKDFATQLSYKNASTKKWNLKTNCQKQVVIVYLFNLFSPTFLQLSPNQQCFIPKKQRTFPDKNGKWEIEMQIL